MFFKKKNKTDNPDFEATKSYGNWLQYDENRNLVKVKGYKPLIPADKIKNYSLQYGNKTYTKKNLGSALAGGLVGGALFGVGGVIAAGVMTGSHQDEYITNLRITINIDDEKCPIIVIPLIIGKMKIGLAKYTLQSAESMIAFLDEITE